MPIMIKFGKKDFRPQSICGFGYKKFLDCFLCDKTIWNKKMEGCDESDFDPGLL
jgi:hypothetical protein